MVMKGKGRGGESVSALSDISRFMQIFQARVCHLMSLSHSISFRFLPHPPGSPSHTHFYYLLFKNPPTPFSSLLSCPHTPSSFLSPSFSPPSLFSPFSLILLSSFSLSSLSPHSPSFHSILSPSSLTLPLLTLLSPHLPLPSHPLPILPLLFSPHLPLLPRYST